MEATGRSRVSDHYARTNLIDAIHDGVARMGKTPSTVTIDDLAPVDEFHIGGRRATEELIAQLRPSATDHLLDVGSGLGGAARFLADRYKCRVTGIDLTPDYVEAGKVLCTWVGLDHRVSLHHASALSIPFPDRTFHSAYMLHVGMNIEDKTKLGWEIARVLRPGALFAVYDVMRTAEGELAYPLPWATTPETNAIAAPQVYRSALQSAGFEILSERDRSEFALTYFHLQSKMAASDGPPPLGLHTLMGERRRAQVRNMIKNISAGRIAPFEMIARKA
jgi:ubiquinone/menaquinone biosynthesis C-methylase UbiE